MIWEILWGFEPALITGFVIAGLILNLTPWQISCLLRPVVCRAVRAWAWQRHWV